MFEEIGKAVARTLLPVHVLTNTQVSVGFGLAAVAAFIIPYTEWYIQGVGKIGKAVFNPLAEPIVNAIQGAVKQAERPGLFGVVLANTLISYVAMQVEKDMPLVAGVLTFLATSTTWAAIIDLYKNDIQGLAG